MFCYHRHRPLCIKRSVLTGCVLFHESAQVVTSGGVHVPDFVVAGFHVSGLRIQQPLKPCNVQL